LVTPVPLSPFLPLCCAYGGGSIKISLQAMPYIINDFDVLKKFPKNKNKICPWPLCLGDKHERHPKIFLPLTIIYGLVVYALKTL
jgi:hypothetical protein